LSNANRDQNYVATTLGVQLDDLKTPYPLVIDQATGRLLVNAVVSIDTTGLASDTNQTSGGQKTQVVDAGGEAVTVTGGKLDVNASVDTTGLALDATLTAGTQKSQLVDAGGEAATVTGGKLDVNASVDTTGLALATNQQTDALTDTQLRATAVSVSGTFYQVTQPVSGTVTANLSATDNTVLDNIDAKTPALGQALAAASVPVILPSATVTTLTPPAAITGFATSAKQLPDNHQVTISNPVTGGATETTLVEVKESIDMLGFNLVLGETVRVIPNSVTTVAGTIFSGNLASSFYQDDNYLVISESASTGITVDFVYTIPTGKLLNSISFHGRYVGIAQHHIDTQVWDYNTSAWVEVSGEDKDIVNGVGDQTIKIELNNPSFTSGNECRIRLKHSVATYNASHKLYIDYLSAEYQGTLGVQLEGVATEATLAKLPGLSIPIHDYISASYNDGTFTETYVYKTGGSGGTTVATVTVIYLDATKVKLVSVGKT